jgi:hypothetical protein
MPVKNRCRTVTWTMSWMQAHNSTQFPGLLFDLALQTQQSIKLSLTVSLKHGQQRWEDIAPVLTRVHEQPQLGQNFFQAPAPPSHSTCLTCVLTWMEPRARQIIQLLLTAPSKHGCQRWEDAMPILTPVCEQPHLSQNFFQAPAAPSHSTTLTCFSTC